MKSLYLQPKEVIKLLEEDRLTSCLNQFPSENYQDTEAKKGIFSKENEEKLIRSSDDTAKEIFNNTFADQFELTAQDVDKKFSKSDLIAHTLVNHFLNSSNFPF